MIISEVVTLGMYAFSMIFLPEYFGAFVFSYPPYASFPVFLMTPFISRRRPRSPCFRSIICRLSAVWMESRSYRCDKRATSVDHQDDQESHRT
jgi:hypothetical protein